MPPTGTEPETKSPEPPEPLAAYELPGTVIVVYDPDNEKAWLNSDTWTELPDES